MKKSQGLQAIEKPLASLPHAIGKHILEHIQKLTHYEPIIGIMGKTGAGKSSLCNALFRREVTPVSDVNACTRDVLRLRLSSGDHSLILVDLPGVGESEQRDNNLEGDDIPEISEANILSTFEQLHHSKADVFERGIINVFKGLSWDYKTNSPCQFGKKIIVNNLVDHNRWGFKLNWGWRRDQLADLERMLFLLDGKPIPENRNDVTVRLSEHINHKSASEIFDEEYFSIRYFQKGTAHITFKRIDLTEKMNDIVAKHYPGMLAAR